MSGRRPGECGRAGLAVGAVTVEPDLSNAGPFLAAALVTGGTVTIPDWPRDSLQAAGAILDVLTRMGARCEVGANGVTSPEPAGSVASPPTCATSTSSRRCSPWRRWPNRPRSSPGWRTPARTRPTGWPPWPRRSARWPGDITELPDGLQITPCPLRAGAADGPFGSYDDHRMVMAAAVLGLVVPGIRVAGADTVAKTFPDFMDVWEVPSWTTARRLPVMTPS